MSELKSLCGNSVLAVVIPASFQHVVESKDATLKGGATRPPLTGVSTQTLKLRPPKNLVNLILGQHWQEAGLSIARGP
jgi:hypothetical protein